MINKISFQQVIDELNDFIGGFVRTQESENTYESKITNIILKNGYFTVETIDNYTVGAAIDHSQAYQHTDGSVHFSIPYVGTAYIYKNEFRG